MRRTLFTGVIAGAALAVSASAQAPLSGAELLAAYTTALGKAAGLKAIFSVQRVGQTAEMYKVSLAKPNLARIEMPGRVVVADGKNVTTFNKAENTYTKVPQTDQELNTLFAKDELAIWGAFFNADAAKAYKEPKSEGTKTRRGVEYRVVSATLDKEAAKSIRFYLDEKDKLARQIEISKGTGADADVKLVDAKILELAQQDATLFSFVAPDGATEVAQADMTSSEWVYDLEEAKKIAVKTNRNIMVDFFATWCGPCKMLDQNVYSSDKFKAMSKYFVFVKIDVDKQKAVSQQFGIEAMPTIKFLRPDGTVIGGFVGYIDLNAFLVEMNKYKS